ncbi:hypothetical protein DB346_23045 [Verrucomicrobia bacterium LW23]|nr:hypothetical protein DB346_23045 [Verrucomicrobia bacterium LW23]
MFTYLYDFTPQVKVQGIDEGYFNVRESKHAPEWIATIVRRAIRESLKITVSEGVGSNKLASQIASKLRKPDNLIHVREGNEKTFLVLICCDRGRSRRGNPHSMVASTHLLSTVRAFSLRVLKWLIRFKRLSIENPLKFVEKISEAGTETYQRRPFTEEELNALISLPTRRSVLYLTAAHTGLRRDELKTLLWSDISLDCESPFIAVRAANAKNKKLQPIPLHSEVVEALKAQRDKVQAQPDHKVFRDICPDWKTFRSDLKRAGIANPGDPSGKVHFHSLRHTLNHRLQNNGVVPTVAQHVMRHSDIKLTTKTYINAASFAVSSGDSKGSRHRTEAGYFTGLKRTYKPTNFSPGLSLGVANCPRIYEKRVPQIPTRDGLKS